MLPENGKSTISAMISCKSGDLLLEKGKSTISPKIFWAYTKAIYMLFNLILESIACGRNYFFHLIDEEIEVLRGEVTVPRETEMVNKGRARFCCVCLSLESRTLPLLGFCLYSAFT